MEIGIIGAGNIGSTLGRKWAAAGHAVKFGVRNPDDAKYDKLHDIGAVVSIGAAAGFSEVVVLALPGAAIPAFAAEHGQLLAGKILIDATNNMRAAEMNSLAILAEKAPEAQLVRAFNMLGWENFAEPEIAGTQIDLFFCGAPSARHTAERLISDMGLRPVYIGDIDTAATLDSMTRLWFALAIGQGYGRRTAFKMLSAE